MKRFLLQYILLCCLTTHVCNVSYSMDDDRFPTNWRITNAIDMASEQRSKNIDKITKQFYNNYKGIKDGFNANNVNNKLLNKFAQIYGTKYFIELINNLHYIYENILYPTTIQKIQELQNIEKSHILVGYLPIDYWGQMIINNSSLEQRADKKQKSFFIDFINNNNALYILYCHDQRNEKYINMNTDVFAITNKTINESTNDIKNTYKDLYLKLLKYKLNTTYNGSKLQSNINNQYYNLPMNEQLQKVIETGINVFGENTIIEILYSLLNDNQYSKELSNFWYSNQLSNEFIAKFMNYCLNNSGKEKTWEILLQHLSCIDKSVIGKEKIKLCSIHTKDLDKYLMDNMYFDKNNSIIYRYGPGVPNQYNISIICNSNDNNHNIMDLYIPISDGKMQHMETRNIASNRRFLIQEFENKYLSHDNNIKQCKIIQSDVMNDYFRIYGPKCVYDDFILRTIKKLNISNNMNLFEITEDNLQALINSGAIENTNHVIKLNNNKEQIPVLNFTKTENNNYLVSVKFINDEQINENNNGITYGFQDIFLKDVLKENIESIIKNKDIMLDNNTFYNNLTQLSIPLKSETNDKNEININTYKNNNEILSNNIDNNEININKNNVNNKILLNNKVIFIKKNGNQSCDISLNFKNASQEDKNTILSNIVVQIITKLASIKDEYNNIKNLCEKLHNILESNQTILNNINYQDLASVINNIFNNYLKTGNADNAKILNNINDIIQMLRNHLNDSDYSDYQEIIALYVKHLLDNKSIKLNQIKLGFKRKILNNVTDCTKDDNIIKELRVKMGLKPSILHNNK